MVKTRLKKVNTSGFFFFGGGGGVRVSETPFSVFSIESLRKMYWTTMKNVATSSMVSVFSRFQSGRNEDNSRYDGYDEWFY